MNMYKVVIVDDEPIIRRGLVEIIDWKKYSCHVCGIASDGLEGIKLIKERLPHIIFTDIRMKNMSGLSMITEAIKIVPRAKVIILTAFGEFDYAQKAVELLVFRFLLKPIRPEYIEKVLEEAVNSIESESLTASGYTKEEKLLFENLLFTEITENSRITNENIEDRLQKYQINLTHFYICKLINFDSSFDNKMIKNILLELSENTKLKFNYLEIESVRELYALIRFDHPMNAQDFYDQFNKILSEAGIGELLVILSSGGYGYRRIKEKFNECFLSDKPDILLKEITIILYTDFAEISSCGYINQRDILINTISAGDTDKLSAHLQNLKVSLYKINQSDNIKLFKILCMDTAIRICKLNETVNGNSEYNTNTIHQLIYKTYIQSDIMDLIETLSVSVTKKIYERNNNTRNVRLEMAVSYIHEHYRENLSRTSVAKSIYISPSYLSFIFKENLNISFSDYLLQIRIEKSKSLLKDLSIKINEIAEMVGIEDPQYFSKVFKKTNGMTPSEYRKNNTGGI